MRSARGFYRFKPDGSKLEFLRSTSNNSWGVGFSEDGLVFGSTANGCPSVYLPIPNRYYEAVRGWAPLRLESIAASNRFYPVTDKVRQVDYHGGFTAAAGHALYTARTYPRHYWNQTAFVAEPTGHLVATFTLERKGSDVVDYYGWNLLASDDEWTAPISAEVGPDGHVWVIDWYNYIVQHNPTPHGFKTGRGNAYETPLRDKTHGRIYRIVYKDARPSRPPALDPGRARGPGGRARGTTISSGGCTPSGSWSSAARPTSCPPWSSWCGDRSVDAIGLNTGVIHALWTLHGLGALADFSSSGRRRPPRPRSQHPSAGVRRNAVQVLPRDARSAGAILAAGLLHDPDAQVRLAALLSLADQPPSDEAGAAVAAGAPRRAGDERPVAGRRGHGRGGRNAESFLKALARDEEKCPPPARCSSIADRVAEHWARGGPASPSAQFLAALTGGEPAVNESILRGLARGWPKDRPARVDGPTS